MADCQVPGEDRNETKAAHRYGLAHGNPPWKGLYVGGHVGNGAGGLGPGTHPVLDQAVFFLPR
jgi:hypothetical protein